MRWLILVVLAVTLAVAGFGCGGGDDSSASGNTTVTETTAEETTSEETTTEETTSADTTTDLSGVLANEDCLALIAAAASFSQAFSGATGTAEQTNAFEELADKVPDEIKADVQVLADAYAKYAANLQDIGIEPGATPTAEQLQQLQAAIASFDSQAITDASERLSAWSQTNCTGG